MNITVCLSCGKCAYYWDGGKTPVGTKREYNKRVSSSKMEMEERKGEEKRAYGDRGVHHSTENTGVLRPRSPVSSSVCAECLKPH